VSRPQQLTIDWQPGLREQFKSLREVLAACIYGSRKGLSGTAADCDLSPSELCKMLSGYENRHLDVDLVDLIVESTGDLRPIYWQMEGRLLSPEVKQARALESLARLSDELPELLRQAGVKGKGR
jgi:hypothetical protein